MIEQEPISDTELRARLLGSLQLFTRTFYKLRTGREFILPQPPGRQSHIDLICQDLVKVFNGDMTRLVINVPPRYGKSELLIHFVAWTLANYPDSNYIYICYSLSLAKKQTQTIRQIITHPTYRDLFGVEISQESSAKDNFETTAGGSVYAAGTGGTITGRGAGIHGINRWGGCVLLDDLHKPGDVISDTIRKTDIDWYLNTLQSRLNDSKTPILNVGQRVHEDDIHSHLIRGFDGNVWATRIIPALDESNNPLNPALHTKDQLLRMAETMPYDFASQYQQNPQPAGGGIFKPEWLIQLDQTPKIIDTFITLDTAETDKSYNDATVFSFWGTYKVETVFGDTTDTIGLHWIDCYECRVEPKDLQDEFMQFYAACMRFHVKPKNIYMEKKSTSVTLSSILKTVRGLNIIDINRTNNKINRFLESQYYLAAKLVSINVTAPFKLLVMEHLRKITANNSHRFDDIADNLADAIRVALIDKIVSRHDNTKIVQDTVSAYINRVSQLKKSVRLEPWHK